MDLIERAKPRGPAPVRFPRDGGPAMPGSEMESVLIGASHRGAALIVGGQVGRPLLTLAAENFRLRKHRSAYKGVPAYLANR